MNDETIRAGFSKCFAHFHHHYFVRFNAVTKRPNGTRGCLWWVKCTYLLVQASFCHVYPISYHRARFRPTKLPLTCKGEGKGRQFV